MDNDAQKDLPANSTITLSAHGSAERGVVGKVADSLHLNLIQFCGGGGFGEVWLVLDSFGWKRALKVINLARSTYDSQREVRGVREYCNRVNDVQCLLSIFHCGETDGYFWYLMQLADDAQRSSNGNYIADTLDLRLSRDGYFTPYSLRPILNQVLDCVEALHSHSLVHRDIKPANVLFVQGRATLGDIGLVTDASVVSLGGTPGYVPQDILDGGNLGDIDGKMQDLYAVGCLIRNMLGIFDVVSRHDVSLPTGRVGRRLNVFLHRACSNEVSRRYRDVESFRRDFEKCYGMSLSGNSTKLMVLNFSFVLVVLLAIVLFAIVSSGGDAGGASGGQAGGASSDGDVETVNWTTMGSTRKVRDYGFSGVLPSGIRVEMSPSDSGLCFMDHGYLRYRRIDSGAGEAKFSLEIRDAIPADFELILQVGGLGAGEIVQRITIGDSGKQSVSAWISNGSFRDVSTGVAVDKSSRGFSCVQRLICVGGQLMLFADDLVLAKTHVGTPGSDWNHIVMEFTLPGAGELHISSLSLNKIQ